MDVRHVPDVKVISRGYAFHAYGGKMKGSWMRKVHNIEEVLFVEDTRSRKEEKEKLNKCGVQRGRRTVRRTCAKRCTELHLLCGVLREGTYESHL